MGWPWANLGRCLHNHKKPLMCFCEKAFLSEPAKVTFGENKDVSSCIKSRLYSNSFARALGGAFAAGTNTMALIQTCQIQAIMTVPQRLCFCAQLSNCNLATSWHIGLSILGLLHVSISIYLRISFSCFMKFFLIENSLWAGLGRILAVACPTTEKHCCLQRPDSVGRLP